LVAFGVEHILGFSTQVGHDVSFIAVGGEVGSQIQLLDSGGKGLTSGGVLGVVVAGGHAESVQQTGVTLIDGDGCGGAIGAAQKVQQFRALYGLVYGRLAVAAPGLSRLLTSDLGDQDGVGRVQLGKLGVSCFRRSVAGEGEGLLLSKGFHADLTIKLVALAVVHMVVAG
jgi:hypothetical protein